MKIEKKKIFNAWIQYKYMRDRGDVWKTELKRLLQIDKLEKFGLYAGILVLIFPQLKSIPWWMIVIPIAVWFIGSEIMSFLVGRLDFHKGLLRQENAFFQKHKNNSPFNDELKMTLKGICEKLGIKDNFTEL